MRGVDRGDAAGRDVDSPRTGRGDAAGWIVRGRVAATPRGATWIVRARRFCGLKFKDPATLLAAGDASQTEVGGSYKVDWKNALFERLPGADADTGESVMTHNCHDIQWAASDDAYWIPSGGGDGNALREYDAATGASIGFVGYQQTSDINHAQFVEQDGVAYLSSRLTSSVLKVNVSAGSNHVLWIAGGADGEVSATHLDGTTYAPGEFPFYDQHNAEYFGDDEVLLVDNQYEQTEPTWYRYYRVDEVAKTWTEVWNYAFAAYPSGNMPMYGDLDRLPTGNVLATFWPTVLSTETTSGGETMDAEFVCTRRPRRNLPVSPRNTHVVAAVSTEHPRRRRGVAARRNIHVAAAASPQYPWIPASPRASSQAPSSTGTRCNRKSRGSSRSTAGSRRPATRRAATRAAAPTGAAGARIPPKGATRRLSFPTRRAPWRTARRRCTSTRSPRSRRTTRGRGRFTSGRTRATRS